MKKIGVITTSCGKSGTFACNYGAVLQGYALVKQLRLLGFEAYDVNYVSENEHHPGQYSFIKRNFSRLKMLFNRKLVKQKIKEQRSRDDQRKLWMAFSQFVKETDLTYRNGEFYNIHQLSEISKDFYAFITGSDVVWNPYLRKGINDEGYFLNFVAPEVKRIAYAPSIGVTELPESSTVNLKELLEKFDGLSIREKTGAKIIKEVTGIDVPVVLDPTLLLSPDGYEEIIRTPEDLPERYMAVYRFGKIEHTKEKILEISKKLNLPVVYFPSNNDGIFEPRFDAGPGEFLGIIKNADLVLSDSFHCTVFALVLHRPFLTFCRTVPQHGKNINSRMSDLLDMVGFGNRMIYPGEEINYSNILDMDFSHAEDVLTEMRAKSLAYLKKALEVEE